MKFTEDKNGCWNFTGSIGQDGYGKISLSGKHFRAHRLMACLTIKSDLADTDVIAHKCDNPKCINPKHLFITTPLGNMQDRDAKGRGSFGEKHPVSKLNADKVISIRSLYAAGESCRSIAPKFAVSQSTIYAVVKGFIWRHVH